MKAKPLLLTGLLLAVLSASSLAQGPPLDDMGVREYDEVSLKANPSKVHQGFFRRTADGKLARNSTGKLMFKIEVGSTRGITMFLTDEEIHEKRFVQTEEEVFRKRLKKELRPTRIQIPAYERKALEALEKGFEDIAVELYREVVRLDPTYLKGYVNLGRQLRTRFEFDEEMSLYEQGLKAGVINKEELYARLGTLLMKLGLPEAAEHRLKLALDANPKHVGTLLAYGRLLMARHSFVKARELLEQAKNLAYAKEEKGACQLAFGEALLKLGDIAGAKKQFEDATFNLPESRDAKLALGSVLFLQGETARAKEIFMEILEISVIGGTEGGAKEGEGGTGEEGSSEGEEGAGEGEGEGESEGSGEGEEGGEEGQEEEEDVEVFTEFSPFKSHVYVNLALCLVRDADYENAEKYLAQAAGIDPTSARPHATRGYLLEKKGDFDGAMAAYDKAVEIDPTDAYSHYARGQVLLGRDDPDGAAAAFQKAIQHNHVFSDAFFKLGLIRLNQGRADEAVRFLGHALALAPKRLDRQVALGVAHVLMGNLKSAEKAFQGVLALDAANLLAKVGEMYLLYYKPKWEAEALQRLKIFLDDSGDKLPPAVDAYLKDIIARIEENAGKAQWLDPFTRPDHHSVGGKWEETKRFGVTISLKENQALFRGEQKNPGDTVMETNRTADEFVKFEMDLRISRFESFRAGLRVVHRMSSGRRRRDDIRAGVFFGRDEKNQLVYGEWDLQFKRWKTVMVLGEWPADETGATKTNRLGIEFVRILEGRNESFKVRFLLDGKPATEDFDYERFKRKLSSGDIWVGVYTSATLKQKVDFTADNAAVVVWKTE